MSLKNAIGGVLLISGTAIGAAVIALPVDTAQWGFIYASIVFTICWLFMTLGALFVLEANLQVGYGKNLISMAEATLGPAGQISMWLLYLILLYALSAAYLTGAGAWIEQGLGFLALPILFTTYINTKTTALIVALLSSVFLIAGTHIIDLFNRVLMVVLFSAFITLVVLAAPQVDMNLIWAKTELLTHGASHRAFTLSPVPLIITAFGFAIIIPSLTDYLHGKATQLRNVVLIGSLFPLALYLLWEFIILGIIPEAGDNGLIAMRQGQPATDLPQALSDIIQNQTITRGATIFSIFALTTSILGVSLSLFDFLADGLDIKKTIFNKILLCLLTFMPPLVFVAYYPKSFSMALSFAGIFVSLILGILPALMVWKGRYKYQLKSDFRVCGGKPLLILTCVFFLFVIGIELSNRLNIDISVFL